MKHTPHTHTHTHTLRPGFSLMEIIIVLGILAVLVGAVAFRFGGFMDDAKMSTVDQDLRGLSTSLNAYEAAGGVLPSDEQGLDALLNEPTTDPVPRRWSRKNEDDDIIDPWGNPYQYQRNGSNDASNFEIISMGPDGKLGTDDDISSQD